MDARIAKMRADMIRRTLYARHEKGSAVRDILETLSDDALIEMDARETKTTIQRLREKRIHRLYTRCEKNTQR